MTGTRRTALRVVRPGPSTLVQDLGRAGYAAQGVGSAGAMDRRALTDANRLLGNTPGAAALEVLGGGLVLQVVSDTWMVRLGADAPVTVNGVLGRRALEVPRGIPTLLEAGDELSVGSPTRGLRLLLAFRGGVAVPPVLGSRSFDTLAGLGPAPLRAGDELATGDDGRGPVAAIDFWPFDPPGEVVTLSVVPGPRLDRFAADTWSRLLAGGWSVSTESDRTGIRLLGSPLERTHTAELPSEGMVAGALQVPPSGLPTILGPDHPVTGGYPVVAVVRERSLGALAHLAPGMRVRFGS